MSPVPAVQPAVYLASFSRAPAAGNDVPMVGPVTSTVQVRDVAAPMLPARSSARTLKVCDPSVSVPTVLGLVHAEAAPLSRVHWNVAPDSAVKANVSPPMVVLLAAGPEVMVGAAGAVRSRVTVTVSIDVSPTLSVALARIV